jgi:hypothetical protein
MSDVKFFQTRIGRTFFDHTLPHSVREIGRLANGIAQLNGLLAQLLAAQAVRKEAP